MIEIIVRETDDEPCVIVVFGCGDHAPRYKITDKGKLEEWKPWRKPTMGSKGTWVVLRKNDK